MAYDKRQFQALIENTLDEFRMNSPAAVNLLLGTAAQESRFGTFLRQLYGGPALGAFQMEPRTHDDIHENYLAYSSRDRIQRQVSILSGSAVPDAALLEYHLKYAIIMTRLHYYRVKEALPPADDVWGLARYWKAHYNTMEGKGNIEEFVRNYDRYVINGG